MTNKKIQYFNKSIVKQSCFKVDGKIFDTEEEVRDYVKGEQKVSLKRKELEFIYATLKRWESYDVGAYGNNLWDKDDDKAVVILNKALGNKGDENE